METLPAKSICVSCIATVGLVSMTIKESQTNQQINSIIPKKDFHDKVEPLFDKIFMNQIQIRTLEKLRDTLLPKLMSGEITVGAKNFSSQPFQSENKN